MRILGLAKHKDIGLSGLDTLIRADFLRPVQIVRQFISNPETIISRISAYHTNIGLSIAPQKSAGHKRINHIPIGITNPIVGYGRYAGYLGLGYIGLK